MEQFCIVMNNEVSRSSLAEFAINWMTRQGLEKHLVPVVERL